MQISNLCIVVPIYQEKLSDDEKISLEFLKKNACKENIYFIAPEGMNIEGYKLWEWKFIFFPRKYFSSVDGYTKLLLSPFFYERFNKYEYMLICQTDALLLRPIREIIPFQNAGYDYFGAPWPGGNEVYCISFKGISLVKKHIRKKICNVGNGGFSLRNISHTIALLREKRKYTYIWNAGEDCFFAYHGLENKCGYRIAPLELACDFALERNAREQIENGRIPLGIHGWKKFYPEFINRK